MNNVKYAPKIGAIKAMLSTLLSIYILFIAMASPAHANRFQAQDFNAPVSDFTARGNSGDLNVDYIIALAFNRGRKIARDAEEFANSATALFTNLADSVVENTNNVNINDNNNGAVSNSVIVPIGTEADTIIVINETQGDSFAIQR